MKSKIKASSLEDVKDLLNSLKKSLRGRVLEAYIFGSIVYGYAIPGESDIDLLIIPKKDSDLEFFHKILSDAIKLSFEKQLPLHIIIYDEKRHGKEMLMKVRKQGFRLT